MKKYIYIFTAFLFILTGYFSITRLLEKPGLPLKYTSDSSSAIKIISVDQFAIESEFQLEFLIDSKKIGDNVKLTYTVLPGVMYDESVALGKYYKDLTFVIISGIVGYIFLIMGLFVIIKKPDNIQSDFLFWTLSLFGTATLTSPGHYYIGGDFIGYIVRTLHVVSYSTGGLFFVLFILVLPVNKLRERKTFFITLSVLTLIAVLFASLFQLRSIFNFSDIRVFYVSWLVLLGLLVISLAYGTTELFKTLRSLEKREDKRKTEWIIWGLTAGVSPYIILWVIPWITGLPIIIKEEYLLAFLIFVPVSFVIAVIRYQVMDIELVVKRSFVYSLLSICILGIYIGLIYLSNILLDYVLGYELRFINLLAVLITALSFNPLRNRLNEFADTVFYREKYKFDHTLINFSTGIKEFVNLNSLSKFVLRYIVKIIPVSEIAAALWIDDRSDVKLFTLENTGNSYELLNLPEFKGLLLYSSVPVARSNSIDRNIGYVGTASEILKNHDVAICIPLMLSRNNIVGSILMSEKLSGLRYSWTDIELLTSLANIAAIEIDRIYLQEKVLAEEIAVTKLEELNRLKSYYVASVSHDLKTPLTSITMFADLLKNSERLNKKQIDEYTDIIIGESGRLTRLIENVLDFAKIENSSKYYDPKPININNKINEVLHLLEYDVNMKNFEINCDFCKDDLYIDADADAFKSSVINLISNSIKFSTHRKVIDLLICRSDGWAVIKITDYGIGIDKNELTNIFDPFYRSDKVKEHHIKGAGLGLSIVKDFVDFHNGTIDIKTEVNKGTTIQLKFPLIAND